MAATEAERLLRIARRDLSMARKLLDPDVEEASWGWALQQTLEKSLKAWLHQLGVKPPPTHDIARLLVLLEQPAGAGRCGCEWATAPASLHQLCGAGPLRR